MKHYVNKVIKHTTHIDPVVLVMQVNSDSFNLQGLAPYKHIIKKMRDDFKMQNFSILPILTNSMTPLPKRIEQLNYNIKKLVHQHGKKVHILCYSMANLPVNGFIHKNKGKDLVKSVLYVASPNQGCYLADSLVPQDLEFMEPALRGTGVHLKWFQEEYSTSQILHYKLIHKKDENVEYYSIGSRTHVIDNIHLRYSYNRLFYQDRFFDTQNDGIICMEEAKEGVHLLNLVHNHYDLMGLYGKIDDNVFKIYADHFKTLDSGSVMLRDYNETGKTEEDKDIENTMDTMDTIDTIETMGNIDTIGTIDTISNIDTIGNIDTMDTIGTIDTMDSMDIRDINDKKIMYKSSFKSYENLTKTLY